MNKKNPKLNYERHMKKVELRAKWLGYLTTGILIIGVLYFTNQVTMGSINQSATMPTFVFFMDLSFAIVFGICYLVGRGVYYLFR